MEWKQWFCTTQFKADGRVIVDTVTFNRINANYREFVAPTRTATEITNIPEEKLFSCWPFVGGFSFACKQWGEVLVQNLGEVVFDDHAFDRLVLPEQQKKLIRSLVVNSERSIKDIITGKGGGCIFLLHGPPGTGKTLTSEAISELLHRPLYTVSVGELGTNTKDLESKLGEILEMASIWKAVILIDEADIFLEKRTEDDIVRNAMVGIFLRLLEYHQGVLFLTTNRVKNFDSAFHSRISIALRYQPLDKIARAKVWGNFLEGSNFTSNIQPEDFAKLAEYEINGREIRTAVRLAKALAANEKTVLDLSFIQRTLKITTQFRNDLLKAEGKTE